MVWASPLCAQPATVKNVANSVYTLTTFDGNGHLLSSTHGVFIDQGTAVSPWKPFIGASSAIVIDAKGNKFPVKAILGANELYNLCKFKIESTISYTPMTTMAASKGDKLWLVGYALDKVEIKQLQIMKVESFMEKYSFYLFNGNQDTNLDGCPLINNAGQVVGLYENGTDNKQSQASDVRLSSSFILNGLSINDPILKATNIRTALPEDENGALLTLMMTAQKNDTARYDAYVDEFIARFPHSVDGYSARATREISQNDFAKAEETMKQALKGATKKDEVHAQLAKIIYEKNVYNPQNAYETWTLDRALIEANEAYRINPLPVYLHQQAQIIFAQGKYELAYKLFMDLTKTKLHGGEIFYEAAQCKLNMKAPSNEILLLLDSAVLAQPKVTSAPYYLARGQFYHQQKEYRKALADYATYDTLMQNNASHEFYYQKYLCEKEIRAYQQALNDIAHAVVLNRMEPTYYAELASLQLKVNKFDDAISTSDLGLRVAPDYADLYIIKGIAQCELKQKNAGLETLRKAKELGDERAEELIGKYGK